MCAAYTNLLGNLPSLSNQWSNLIEGKGDEETQVILGISINKYERLLITTHINQEEIFQEGRDLSISTMSRFLGNLLCCQNRI